MSNILTIVRKLLAQLVPVLLLLLAQLVAAGSVWALFTWPHWWLLGALVLFVATLVSFGFVMLAAFILDLGRSDKFEQLVGEQVALPHDLELFCKAYLLLIGYPLDYLLNAAVFTVLLFWPPMETTTTERLQKHVKRGGWFGLVARYFASVWVNPLELVNRPHVPMAGDR